MTSPIKTVGYGSASLKSSKVIHQSHYYEMNPITSPKKNVCYSLTSLISSKVIL